MKALLPALPLMLLALLCTAPSAGASDLDRFLIPRCGVDEPEMTPAQIVQRYGAEILSRAGGYLMLDAEKPENEILMWYLGAMTSPEGRALASQVVRNGAPTFRMMVMGAVSYSPDWSGLKVVAIGLEDADDMVRDSASSVLYDIDYTALPSLGKEPAEARTLLLETLERQIARERDDRLRGYMHLARTKLQALQLAGS